MIFPDSDGQTQAVASTVFERCTCNETAAGRCQAVWHVPPRMQEADPARNREERRRMAKISRRSV